MNVIIEINGEYVLVNPSSTAALIEALGNGRRCITSGFGSDKKYVPVEPEENRISLSVVSDSMLEKTPEPLAQLQKEKQLSDSRWVEYYNKSQVAEKALADLEAKLVAKGIEIKD
jgi:hypothetical protein